MKESNFRQMFLGFEYIKYRWNAKKRHGVHSPFLYELTDRCFRKVPNNDFQSAMRLLEERCAKEDRTIQITDYGVGSRKLGNERKIAQIFKTSSSHGKYGKMLHLLVQHYPIRNCLELGTSLGIGSTCLATGSENVRVLSIEGCPNTFREAQKNFDALGLTNVETRLGRFDQVLPALPEQTFDLIFIDGHHDGEATLRYLEALIPYANTQTFLILDDIRWSASMYSAWEQIVSDPRFHVTIDLFRMGIVLLREQQEKEHFVIRL